MCHLYYKACCYRKRSKFSIIIVNSRLPTGNRWSDTIPTVSTTDATIPCFSIASPHNKMSQITRGNAWAYWPKLGQCLGKRVNALVIVYATTESRSLCYRHLCKCSCLGDHYWFMIYARHCSNTALRGKLGVICQWETWSDECVLCPFSLLQRSA